MKRKIALLLLRIAGRIHDRLDSIEYDLEKIAYPPPPPLPMDHPAIKFLGGSAKVLLGPSQKFPERIEDLIDDER